MSVPASCRLSALIVSLLFALTFSTVQAREDAYDRRSI